MSAAAVTPGAAAAGAMLASPGDDTEVRVSFFTRRLEFAIPDTPIAVPGRLRRAALSAVVNHILRMDPPVAFDFLVSGEFLRTTLTDYMTTHNIYKEEILKLEVVKALPPPQPPHDHPHEDWIGAIGALQSGVCVTGCYDHVARIWNTSGELVAKLTGHQDTVSAVAWVPQSESVDTHACVTGSGDETLRRWQVDLGARTAQCSAICTGHTDAITSVAVQPTGKMFASGSADRTILLWSTTPDASSADPGTDDATDSGSGKRRRVKRTVPTETPLGKLTGSTSSVSSVCWPDRETLYSGGNDQCLRTWNIETGTCVRSMTGYRVISAVASSPVSRLLATGDFDGAVRLYDPRSADGSVVKAALVSHRQPCTSVAWSPTDANLLVSGSLDDVVGAAGAAAASSNNLKLWDVRSQRIPLHNLTGHTDKVLAVAWPTATLVAAGGADGQLRLHTWADADTVTDRG
eukprot:m.84760 g.84760  ORF g.84760 m.84760 type:complete len:462 (+) comp9607_c0_seq2:271-1656(+)